MTSADIARYEQLKIFLKSYDITQLAIAKKLNVRQQTVNGILRRETMQPPYHKILIDLGLPSALLPVPLDRPVGRPVKIPRWPALNP